jgi:hypothetical protein
MWEFGKIMKDFEGLKIRKFCESMRKSVSKLGIDKIVKN